MSAAFDIFARLIRARTGVELTPDRREFLAARLMPLARRHGLSSIEALANALEGEADEALAAEVIEATAITETAFFRDRDTFAAIRDGLLPRLIALRAGTRRLRLWSAGCSTGQEPYSLAMILARVRERLAGWAVEIVATDLSDRLLDKARAGVFTQFEVQRGLPVRLLIEHFERCGESWCLADAIRSRVSFGKVNLIEALPGLGAFDLILCRNVLARFGAAEREAALLRLSDHLAPGGFLVLGAEEGPIARDAGLAPVPGAPSLFRQLAPGLRLAAG